MKKLIALLVAMAAFCQVTEASVTDFKDLSKWRFFTTYKRGGETCAQLEKRLAAKGIRADFITNLAYFTMDDSPIQAFDLQYSSYDPQEKVPYRKDLARPIVVITNRYRPTIYRPGKVTWQYPSLGWARDYVAVSDYLLNDYKIVYPRQVVGISGNRMTHVADKCTYAWARKKLLKKGYKPCEIVSFDGGHTLDPKVAQTSHLVGIKVAK